MNHAVIGCAAAAATGFVLLSPARARAQSTEAFGRPGQIAISNDASVGASGETNIGSTYSLYLQPALDVFVVRGLSVGGRLTYAAFWDNPTSASAQSSSSAEYGVAPRVGYDLPFSDSFSFWPKASVSYALARSSSGGVTTTTSYVGAQLIAPVLFHPVYHFYLGLGPQVGAGLWNSSNFANGVGYGVAFVMGGWFGGGGALPTTR